MNRKGREKRRGKQLGDVARDWGETVNTTAIVEKVLPFLTY